MSKIVLLLGVVLLAQSALSLSCYRCAEQYTGDTERTANDNGECMEEYECDDAADLDMGVSYTTCYTRVTYSEDTGKLKINKGCYMKSASDASYASCEADRLQTEVNYYCSTDYDEWQCFSCCEGDLCNKSAVSMVTFSALSLLLGVVAFLMMTV